MKSLTLNINGEDVMLLAEPRESLADVLRERLSLTGTHLGCEHGACGACTVEVDGKATRACLVLGVMAEGRRVRTIEGLRDDPVMLLLRRHFHEQHALQCGFCTPGMLIMARELLKNRVMKNSTRDSNENRVDNDGMVLSESDVREGMAGQICRCTGYAGIVRAIMEAAKELRTAEAST